MYSTPKVTIDLAEYEALKANQDLKRTNERHHNTYMLTVVHQIFIKRLYDELSQKKKLTVRKMFNRIASEMNAKVIHRPGEDGLKPTIEIVPLSKGITDES